MAELLANRWAQLVLVGVLTALLGTGISALVFSRGSSGLSIGLVRFTTGSSLQAADAIGRRGLLGDDQFPVEYDLPLTAADAVATGWKDPALCSPGRGRYFQRAGGEEKHEHDDCPKL